MEKLLLKVLEVCDAVHQGLGICINDCTTNFGNTCPAPIRGIDIGTLKGSDASPGLANFPLQPVGDQCIFEAQMGFRASGFSEKHPFPSRQKRLQAQDQRYFSFL